MTPQEIHEYLVEQFGSSAILHFQSDAKDPWIEVSPDKLVEICTFLKNDEQCQFQHLNNLTGVDYLETDPKKAKKFPYDPHIEVVYHLSSFTLLHRIALKVKLPRWLNDEAGQIPEAPSVSSVWAIADWHEREAYDLMGIRFVDHPNLVRILCPEDWVGHPLRKDYEFPEEYHGIRG